MSDALNNEETSELSDSEFDAMVKAEVAKYEPYWRKVIAVYHILSVQKYFAKLTS